MRSDIEGLGGKDGVWEKEDRMAKVTERLEELQGARCRKCGCLRCPEQLRVIGHAIAEDGEFSLMRMLE